MSACADFSLVTYSGLPDLDVDDRLLVRRLGELGFSCDAVVWNDDSVDWGERKICIIRSTWDYHLHHRAFSEWATRVADKSTLFNEIALVRWNMDKSYLGDLYEQGIPIVPTIFYQSRSSANLHASLEATDWEEIIVKPTIGLCTHGVRKFSCTKESLSEAQQHIDNLLTESGAMVQPYMQSVETYGERSLIFIDGEFTHAVRKSPFQTLAMAGEAGESPAAAKETEVDLGYNVIACLDTIPLYARVDIVEDDKNKPHLIELELIEPSLFLAFSPVAVERLAEAILKRIKPLTRGMNKNRNPLPAGE